jgi:hypothetical protein
MVEYPLLFSRPTSFFLLLGQTILKYPDRKSYFSCNHSGIIEIPNFRVSINTLTIKTPSNMTKAEIIKKIVNQTGIEYIHETTNLIL